MKKFIPILLVLAVGAILITVLPADVKVKEHSIFSKITSFIAAHGPQEVTIAAEGAGGGNTDPGVYTLTTPAKSQYQFTCGDTDNCRLTMGETSIADGQLLEVINVGTPTIVVTEVSGAVEGAGAITLGQYDCIEFRYIGTTWIEVGRSNN